MLNDLIKRNRDNKNQVKKYNDVEDLFGDFQKEMNSLIENFFGDVSKGSDLGALSEQFSPDFEISEDDETITVKGELSGMNEDDIDVEFDNNILTIKGEKKEEDKDEDEKKNYHVRERSYGYFERNFNIPKEIENENIKAEFKDGVLKIVLPKTSEEKSNKKKIEIQS